MDENPYESPGEPENGPAPNSARRSLWANAGIALGAFIGCVFLIGYLGVCFELFHNGYAWPVIMFNTLAFMIVPQFDGGPWRERIAVSLSVPLAVFGGWAGFHVFCALPSWSWAVFNNPLGMAIFVIGFAAAAAVLGWWSIHRVLRFWKA
ncbi:MAG: hypothetical protein V3R99_12265 [Thermoguttaceae bacterium]